ncbi:hypothetical protein MMC07_006455 [Pseudocyphellaria aurata]|nr:hypothetical protein [Pseudocyphellaria aurata]
MSMARSAGEIRQPSTGSDKVLAIENDKVESVVALGDLIRPTPSSRRMIVWLSSGHKHSFPVRWFAVPDLIRAKEIACWKLHTTGARTGRTTRSVQRTPCQSESAVSIHHPAQAAPSHHRVSTREHGADLPRGSLLESSRRHHAFRNATADWGKAAAGDRSSPLTLTRWEPHCSPTPTAYQRPGLPRILGTVQGLLRDGPWSHRTPGLVPEWGFGVPAGHCAPTADPTIMQRANMPTSAGTVCFDVIMRCECVRLARASLFHIDRVLLSRALGMS